MEAAEAANVAIQRKYTKDKKVGEGTYAVVYVGKEVATARKIAIKKVRTLERACLRCWRRSSVATWKLTRAVGNPQIKVGQFKDGLDMSAIREVKFLRELRHPNVIEVRCTAVLEVFAELTRPLHQLLDVFSNKSNLNLVLEFLDTDLEAVIRDKALVFQGVDVKSWMLMTMKGLDFCHTNWILHRVSASVTLSTLAC